jgi:large subunit ribosomal protein L7A
MRILSVVKCLQTVMNSLMKEMVTMHRLQDGSKIVGTKQTLRALERNQVEVLFVAEDANKRLLAKLTEMAEANHIAIVYVKTMEELGKACNVKVKAATAALIVNNSFSGGEKNANY